MDSKTLAFTNMENERKVVYSNFSNVPKVKSVSDVLWKIFISIHY